MKLKLVSQKRKCIIVVIAILVAIILLGFYAFSLYGKYQMSKIPAMSSDEIIRYTTQGNENAVITVGIIKDGQASYTVYGEEGEVLPQELHTYEIGSLTKTLTAAMICKAVEDSLINLEDTIDKYIDLPNGNNYPTITQLLTHTSGYKAYYFENPMISHFLSGRNDFYGITRDMVTNKIGSLSVADNENSFVYSNFGYAVLGLVLENVYGQDYRILLNQFTQNDLGLTHTQISDQNGDLGNYWDWNKNDAYLSAGAVTSNIEDMLVYAQMQLEEYDVFERCHKSIKSIDVTSEQYQMLGINMDQIGMAWIIDATNTIVWHNGGTEEYNCYLGFNLETGTAVIILSNLSPNYRIPATVLGTKKMSKIQN